MSTVTDEHGFEAWSQLHPRFEQELDAQTNIVRSELHSILAATFIEDIKNKIAAAGKRHPEAGVKFRMAINIESSEAAKNEKTEKLKMRNPISAKRKDFPRKVARS